MYETELDDEKIDRNIKLVHVKMGFQSLADLLIPFIICTVLSVILACIPALSLFGLLALFVIQIIYFVRLKKFGDEMNNDNLKKAVYFMIANAVTSILSVVVIIASAFILISMDSDNMTLLYVIAVLMSIVALVFGILYIKCETEGFAEVVSPFNSSEAYNWDAIRGILIASTVVSTISSVVEQFNIPFVTFIVSIVTLVLAIVAFVKKWKAIYSCKDLYDMKNN